MLSQQPDPPATTDSVDRRSAPWARVAQSLAGLRALAQRYYRAMDRATGGLPRYLAQAWRSFNQRDVREAASLSYYAIFSIFPLILLAVALVSGLVGPALAQQQILTLVGGFFPQDSLQLIEENVRLALQQRQSFGLVALLGLGWSGLSLFSNLATALDGIFHPAYLRPLWHKRLLALLMTTVLAVLLLASLLTSAIFHLLDVLLLGRPSPILTVGTLFLPLGLNATLFALLFRFVPQLHVRWDAIWPAALLGGLGWELAKSLFVWYLDNFGNYSLIYGSLGTVIVLLFWAYLSASILLLCAELCAALNNWLEARARAGQQPGLPAAPTPPA